MIDKTINNMKKILEDFKNILTAKISEKKKLYKVLKGVLTEKIAV